MCYYALIKQTNKILEEKENQECINMRLVNINGNNRNLRKGNSKLTEILQKLFLSVLSNLHCKSV